MTLQTPRQLRARPSLGNQSINTTSSPSLNVPASTAMARKASLNALTASQMGPATPTGKMLGGDGRELEVGDTVDVPGDMHGVIKFIGSVKGKKGVFAGVELSRDFAGRGKNDGDVDGTRYFTTSIPGSGIFLPLQRASKRASPTISIDSFPPTPTTPSFANYNVKGNNISNTYSPLTASLPKFSQSVGPGARPPSPVFKPKTRPSLPRPESPFRKQPHLAPTPGRGPSLTPASFSRSQIGAPRFTPSPAPAKTATVNVRTQGPPRPFSRNNSRLGNHARIDEDADTTPLAANGGSSGSMSGQSRPRSKEAEEEIQNLKKKLEERDKQLQEQVVSLAEMEVSLTELQNLMPRERQGPTQNGYEDADAAQLRALLREKNEKISMLTAEFDAHRADFRSTIDTLEMASTETERVYEKRVEDLLQEIKELQDRGEDVESVATQLKQLEELVQELEEGLEDARRGEAEARGEVEFLRGEVERGRSELRREREKAAAALKGAGAAVDGSLSPSGSKEVEQRDDEIRGLKAIIHSLSSGPDMGSPSADHGRASLQRNGTFPSTDSDELSRLQAAVERLEREKEELRGLIERKSSREDELEKELDRMRKAAEADPQRQSVLSNGVSDHTAMQEKRSSGRDSKGTIVSWRDSPQISRHEVQQLPPMMEFETASSGESSGLWCEICETGGHDILNCSNVNDNNGDGSAEMSENGKRNGRDAVIHGLRNLSVSPSDDYPAPLTPSKRDVSARTPPAAPLPNPYEQGLVAGNGSSTADPDKWCALCERDGHDATACPFEDAL